MERATGKIILLGEHAVVYGVPAIAAPVSAVALTIEVESVEGTDRSIEAADPTYVERALRRFEEEVGRSLPDGLHVRVESDIPIGGGLGSSAALAVALVRAAGTCLGRSFTPDEEGRLTRAIEALAHGTPSGIDDGVIRHGRPIRFRRTGTDSEIVPLRVGAPLELIVADTGVAGDTGALVTGVRRLGEEEPDRLTAFLDGVRRVVGEAERAIAAGEGERLGDCFKRNQVLLREVGVSGPEIETLVKAAERAGALGAKLSGAGGGGNVIVLVTEKSKARVEAALKTAGATRTLPTTVT